MKIDWNRKYTTISVYAFIVICCSIVFYTITSDLSVFTVKISGAISILSPFIIGAVMAYVLNFVLKFWEETILTIGKIDKLKPKAKRSLGLLLTYLTAFFLVYLFMYFVLPQLIQSVSGLINDVPYYIHNMSKTLDDLTKNFNVSKEYLDLAKTKLNDVINYIINVATNIIPIFGIIVKTIASSIWNIILGLIISIYLLIDKENFYALSKKMTYAIFSKPVAKKLIELTHRSNDTFGKFISGKILDSFIIGILTFIVLTIFNMPYTILISVIIGITNIIPFFGPFFGAVPSAIIILFVSPVKALWFLLIILVIQQIDGNIIGPKILGDSIGISAFWILFSLLVAGKFLGIVGMIIGVPLFAVIYSIVKEVIESKLEKKGMPKKTKNYM